jgi:hypothetical protein
MKKLFFPDPGDRTRVPCILGRCFTTELYTPSHKKTFEGDKCIRCLFFFFWDWNLNSDLSPCKAGTLPLEPCFQSILLWLFWRWGRGGVSHELFAWGGLQSSPLLSLPPSQPPRVPGITWQSHQHLDVIFTVLITVLIVVIVLWVCVYACVSKHHSVHFMCGLFILVVPGFKLRALCLLGRHYCLSHVSSPYVQIILSQLYPNEA